jgi:energy-coupling factor transport system ATP-binding protein
LHDQGVAVDPIPISRDEVARVLNDIGLHKGIDVPEGVRTERKYERTGSEELILSVKDLSFSYPTREGVLQGISFDVYAGETVAILGQNGSGKTTLISQLPGILKPTSGDVIVKGINTKTAKIQDLARHVAFVFQYPDRQFITTSVEGELAHSLKANKTPPEEMERRVEEFLRRIELLAQRKEHPFSLSHGQKRRLSVACMQIAEPELIILDEPTFGLDWQQVTRLMDYLYELTKEGGATTMFVTHDMRLVAKYAQRVIVLHDSRVVFEGAPSELFANTDVLAKTKLNAPPVWYFTEQAIGSGLGQPEELGALVAEVRKG